jgi:hypothetical protein
MAIGTIEIAAASLLELIQVAEVTIKRPARGEETPLDGVCLFTATGEYGATPGVGSILCALSSNGVYAAQTTRICAGELKRPVVIEQSRFPSLYTWLKLVIAQGKREEDSAPTVHWAFSNGYDSTMRATPADVETMRVNAHDVTDYPLQTVLNILQAAAPSGPTAITNKDGADLPAGPMLSLGSSFAKAFAVQRIMRGRLDFYPPPHPAGTWTVEDKLHGWRAAIPADKYDLDTDLTTPEVPLYTPPGMSPA